MKLSTFATAALLTTAGVAPVCGAPAPAPRPGSAGPAGLPTLPSTPRDSSSAGTDQLATQGAANLAKYIQANGYPNNKCTKDNAAVRREW